MNTKALEAITSPNPDHYSRWARMIAARCWSDAPKYLRPRLETAWAMVAWFLAEDERFRELMQGRGKAGISRFVATVIDIWGYWLNEK